MATMLPSFNDYVARSSLFNDDSRLRFLDPWAITGRYLLGFNGMDFSPETLDVASAWCSYLHNANSYYGIDRDLSHSDIARWVREHLKETPLYHADKSEVHFSCVDDMILTKLEYPDIFHKSLSEDQS